MVRRTKRASVNKKSGEQAVTAGSGNVFSDLGLPDATEALAKTRLAQRIADVIGERRLTQTQAAHVLGIDQPKVSALLCGRLTGFSTDRLFRFLNALDQDIEIVIREKPRGMRRHATVCIAVG
jgi:predicted XRE-type DNA-binding protein